MYKILPRKPNISEIDKIFSLGNECFYYTSNDSLDSQCSLVLPF